MKRRILAAILAATMVFGSSMTVLAADTTQDATAAGDTSITGTGTVENLPSDVIKVTLPKNVAIVADPSGVYGAAVAAGGTLENVDKESLAAYAGKIILKGDELIVNNMSSVPVKVTATFSDKSTSTTPKTDIADVNSGVTTEYNTWLAVVPSKTDIVGDITKYDANEQGVSVTTAGTAVNLYLPGPKYLISGVVDENGDVTTAFKQEPAEGDKGHGQAFDIIGFINKDAADWSTHAVKVDVKFTVAKAASSDTADATLPYGLMAGATMVELGTAPTLGDAAVWDEANLTVEVDCTLGDGIKAQAIQDVYYGSSQANTLATADMYSVSGGKFKLVLPSAWDGWTSAKGLKVYIRFTDGTNKTLTCTDKP